MNKKFDLLQRRKELNLTLEDIGNHVGVSKSTVKKWETGYIENMKRDKIALLADILQVSPLVIMGYNISPQQNAEFPLQNGNFQSNNSKPLSQFDSELLVSVQNLNDKGKAKVKEYINDLLMNPNYADKAAAPTPSLGDYLEIAAYGGEGNRNPKKKLQILD